VLPTLGYREAVPVRDEDDWVGEPPEGHYTRDRAKPEFWRKRWPLAWAGIAIALLILLIVLLLG
jgi:hypothetical protein